MNIEVAGRSVSSHSNGRTCLVMSGKARREISKVLGVLVSL